MLEPRQSELGSRAARFHRPAPGGVDVTGITEPAIGRTTTETETPSRQPVTVGPALLTAGDIELELQRLVRRLVAGAHLLRRSQTGNRDGQDHREVLLDLKVDEVRCLLTRIPNQSHQPEVRLTPREREVARMVAQGLTNTAIAGKLALSPWTVSTHLRRIFAKLGVTTRAAMVAVIAAADSRPNQP
jgi:DNA-binding CsgD family transcriptional regulator